MPTRKKPAGKFDLDAFSSQLEQMAATDKPTPPPKESDLVKVVRERYEPLKSAIVDRKHSYRDVCILLTQHGLKKGVYPRALKEALVKIALERGEVWDDGRGKPEPENQPSDVSGTASLPESSPQVKIALERGEDWDDGRRKPEEQPSEEQPSEEQPSNHLSTASLPESSPQAKSEKAGEFVEMPQKL